MNPPVVLAVAAHDPLGGAGLAADLPTLSALGVHAVAVVTAVTAQRLGSVGRVDEVPLEGIEGQLAGILAEFEVAGVKTGLLGRVGVVRAVADLVGAGALPAPVVDPVLLDGRGRPMFAPEVERAYRDELLPVASVSTPNLAEASRLIGTELIDADDVVHAAPRLAGLGAGVTVVTGGRATGETAADVAIGRDGTVEVHEGVRIATRNVRGSGCTFAAAVVAGLANGLVPMQAVRAAKSFVTERLVDSADWDLGCPDDAGPLSHRMGPARQFLREGQGTSAQSSP